MKTKARKVSQYCACLLFHGFMRLRLRNSELRPSMARAQRITLRLRLALCGALQVDKSFQSASPFGFASWTFIVTVSPLRRISSHGMTQTRTMSCSILARFLFSTTYFHYKNPGFLTETGVSDFPRRREVRYHTAAKAVTAVNKPFLRRIRQNPQLQVQFLQKFSVQTGHSVISCPTFKPCPFSAY